MSHIKPSIPKGTRDFTPPDYVRRKYIFTTIEQVFLKYGYKPIETPSFENLSTLTGKYGDEGDKLIFKILNSGDFLAQVDEDAYARKDTRQLTPQISEKALRYDLTVPFARFVVQNFNALSFPFKRYQMQAVWRADRPQKGRYREFYQCDIDVIGSTSLLNEAELIKISDDVFKNLGINVTIKINNRKVLNGIAEVIGAKDRFNDITVALDKIDKIGPDKVKEELVDKGISQEAVGKMALLFNTAHQNNIIEFMTDFLSTSEVGMQGLQEVKTVCGLIEKMDVKAHVRFDVMLARGLNYYTGSIFEIVANDTEMGSISGGGRYDDLTGIFGLSNMSGVGISYGADRIYDVMQTLQLFPEHLINFTKVLILNFGPSEIEYILPLALSLREKGFATEIYPDNVKMKKQMSYADKNNIPYVIMAGEQEVQQQLVSLKNMTDGSQQQISFNALLQQAESFIKK